MTGQWWDQQVTGGQPGPSSDKARVVWMNEMWGGLEGLGRGLPGLSFSGPPE